MLQMCNGQDVLIPCIRRKNVAYERKYKCFFYHLLLGLFCWRTLYVCIYNPVYNLAPDMMFNIYYYPGN